MARGGDARGGEEAVPAAPPPPPCAALAPPTRPRGGGGQGASPGGQEPLGAGVVRGALPADLGRCERGHRARSGSRAAGYAAQHTRVTRPDARQPAARRRALASLRRRRLRAAPGTARAAPRAPAKRDSRSAPGRPRASPARSARGSAPSRGWRPASAARWRGAHPARGKPGPSPRSVGLSTPGLRGAGPRAFPLAVPAADSGGT